MQCAQNGICATAIFQGGGFFPRRDENGREHHFMYRPGGSYSDYIATDFSRYGGTEYPEIMQRSLNGLHRLS